MKKLAIQSLLIACLGTALGACSVGSTDLDTLQLDSTQTDDGNVTYLDTDMDGLFDAIDVDGDGFADYMIDFESCETDECLDVRPVAYCSSPVVYSGGQPIGLDWNCDGKIDVRLSSPTSGGSGSTSTCKTSVWVNGVSRKIVCDKDGGSYDCACYLNGSRIRTCTTSSSSACSQPGGGNCCGF